MKHPLPDAALDGRIAIVGISGSGKSTTAKGGVERLLHHGKRVCIVDLLDGWWGLRVGRDGHTPAFPVAIFGGQHGDLPLTEHAGALIGQAVAQSQGSTIVSLSELDGDAARRRFALAFFNALHNANRAPLHLVIDECDFYSPQQPVKDGPGPLLLNRVKEIAARGRMRGFRCWTVTQRPAKLHKDVLSQADTLVAMQLTSSQDRAAIEGWIGDQGDKQVGKSILASLPSLQRGQGVVWSPRIGVLDTVRFPLPETYDSSRTPEYGEAVADVELKPIDLGALREKMGKVEAETKANDPAALKKRIRELEGELAKKPTPNVDQAAITLARQTALTEGMRLGFDDGAAKTRTMYGERIRAFVDTMDAASKALLAPMPHASGLAAVEAAQIRPSAKHTPPSVLPLQRTTPRPNGQFSSTLPRAERLILTVLAQRHPERVPMERVAAIAGYSAGGGGFNNALSSLRGKALIEPGPSPLAITTTGLDTLGAYDPLPTGPELLHYWTARVGKAERAVLEALANNGTASKDEVAARAGYAADGGGFNNALSRLRTLGLITGRGMIELHEDLR